MTLGSAERWGTIYHANRGKIPNPRVIYPGQILTIPR
jgi:nucleoid-associated protein YgaU